MYVTGKSLLSFNGDYYAFLDDKIQSYAENEWRCESVEKLV